MFILIKILKKEKGIKKYHSQLPYSKITTSVFWWNSFQSLPPAPPRYTHTYPATSESKPRLKEEVFQNTFPAYIHQEGQIQVCTDILLWQRPTFSLPPAPCHTYPGTGWPLWPEYLDLAYRQRFALIMHSIIVPIHTETAFPIRAHWSSPFTCFSLFGKYLGFPPQDGTPFFKMSAQLFTFPIWTWTVSIFSVLFKSFLPARVPSLHCCLSISSSFPLWFSVLVLDRSWQLLRLLNSFA